MGAAAARGIDHRVDVVGLGAVRAIVTSGHFFDGGKHEQHETRR